MRHSGSILFRIKAAHRDCLAEFSNYVCCVTVIAHKLDQKLAIWQPETANHVESPIEEIIKLANSNALEIRRSRAAIQDVLNRLDAE